MSRLVVLLGELQLVFSYRRAEWCRILGVIPKTKRVVICSAHFSDVYIFGKRLSHFAVPNPPEVTKLKPQNKNMILYSSKLDRNFNVDVTSTNSSLKLNEIENSNVTNDFIPIHESSVYDNELVNESVTRTEEFVIRPQDTNNLANESINQTDTEEFEIRPQDTNEPASESIAKTDTEDFEIRQQDTNEVILQFRCIKSKDSVVLSFITPQKSALQEQIKYLDEACSKQLKEIREMKIINARLREKLKFYRWAMLKFRHVKPKNRYLNFRLKKLQQRVINLKRRLQIIESCSSTCNEFLDLV